MYLRANEKLRDFAQNKNEFLLNDGTKITFLSIVLVNLISRLTYVCLLLYYNLG